MRRPPLPRYGDLSIRLKLLAPFVILMVIWGGFGSYVLARGAASEARARATATLASAHNGARSAFSDAETGLLETVRLAANTQGVADAVQRRSIRALRRLLLPIAANAEGIRLDVVAPDGSVIIGIWTADAGARVSRSGMLVAEPVLRAAQGDADALGDKWSGIDGDAFVVAGPVRDARGRAIAALAASARLDDVVARIAGTSGAGVVLFTASGSRVGRTPLPYRPAATDGVREMVMVGDEPHEALYGPLEARGRTIGVLAIALERSVAMGNAYGTARTLALLVGLAVLAVVGLGMLTARAIARPLGSLLDATRALERGDLHARADVRAHDEVGTLAASFNMMAAELQSSHSELESKVAERTGELAHANEELARASDAKSRFLASMSHELRTPLNAIIGFADMLGDPVFGPVRAGETRELAGNILASGRHLLTLINDVLDLAKIEAGKIEVDPRPTDLAEVMREVLAVVRPLAAHKSQDLSLDVPADLPDVEADPARLRQILFNLLANAIKFTPEGGSVSVSVAAEAARVTIAVADTGPGLTPEEAEEIFHPFERGRASPAVEGAGLGLALAKHLVELHGGVIWARGRPGFGSTFSFTLPPTQEAVSLGA